MKEFPTMSIISRMLVKTSARIILLAALIVMFQPAALFGRVASAQAPAEAPAQAIFKASTAQVDIAPSNNGFPRMFLAGFAGRGATPADGTLPGEPALTARALALWDGSSSGNVNVIVTADILGFTHDLRQRILADVSQ